MPWISQQTYNLLWSWRDEIGRVRTEVASLRTNQERILRTLNLYSSDITEALMALSGEFSDLESAVAANTDQGASAKQALEMLAAKIESNIQAAKDLDEAKAKAAALATQLRSNNETIANAILRTDGDPSNDPATPPEEGGGPFTPSQQG